MKDRKVEKEVKKNKNETKQKFHEFTLSLN